MYTDITLKCKDCGADFVFTAGEQEFYAEKGFTNQPQRCKACRDAKKNARAAEPSTRLLALAAAVSLEFPSSRRKTDPYTAATASQR